MPYHRQIPHQFNSTREIPNQNQNETQENAIIEMWSPKIKVGENEVNITRWRLASDDQRATRPKWDLWRVANGFFGVCPSGRHLLHYGVWPTTSLVKGANLGESTEGVFNMVRRRIFLFTAPYCFFFVLHHQTTLVMESSGFKLVARWGEGWIPQWRPSKGSSSPLVDGNAFNIWLLLTTKGWGCRVFKRTDIVSF